MRKYKTYAHPLMALSLFPWLYACDGTPKEAESTTAKNWQQTADGAVQFKDAQGELMMKRFLSTTLFLALCTPAFAADWSLQSPDNSREIQVRQNKADALEYRMLLHSGKGTTELLGWSPLWGQPYDFTTIYHPSYETAWQQVPSGTATPSKDSALGFGSTIAASTLPWQRKFL